MNENDQFEQRLRGQPLKTVPSAWRAEILSAARNAIASRQVSRVSLYSLLWHELIWPCRRIWVGLAPVWLALLVFNVAHSDRGQIVTAKSTMPPGEMRLAHQEQQRILAEIIGPTPPASPASPAEPPRRSNHQPRSERRSVAMA